MTAMSFPMDLLCPMHVTLSPEGRVLRAGPTFRKLFAPQDVEELAFLDLLEVVRPQGVRSMNGLADQIGQSLQLRLRAEPHTSLKAIAIPDPVGEGMLINMSFGISVLEAVQDFALTNTDFAPTDLTIEMLYLVEAKSAAMDASRRLNRRLEVAKTAAETQALTDALTGVQNRRGLEQFASRALTRGVQFALMHVDLDHFKQINDTLGHGAGDLVLQEAARIMRQETRHRDGVARIGGDEFVLAIDDAPSIQTVEQIAERILKRFAQPIISGDLACQVSCSIGSVFSQDFEDPGIDQLLRYADEALYASKDKGRACHTIFNPTDRVNNPSASLDMA